MFCVLKVNIMIDLVEHMPDEHKLELWTIWKKMTERVKYLIGNDLLDDVKGGNVNSCCTFLTE